MAAKELKSKLIFVQWLYPCGALPQRGQMHFFLMILHTLSVPQQTSIPRRAGVVPLKTPGMVLRADPGQYFPLERPTPPPSGIAHGLFRVPGSDCRLRLEPVNRWHNPITAHFTRHLFIFITAPSWFNQMAISTGGHSESQRAAGSPIVGLW